MKGYDDKLADIEGRVADACGVLNVAHAKLVELTRELIESEVWRGYGIRSVEHWLTLKAGLSSTRARQIVDVATAAAQLPVTVRTFADGELSFEQVHAVAQHPGKFRDAEAASFARVATVTQIRRTLSRYEFTAPASAEAHTDDQEGDTCSAVTQPESIDSRIAEAVAKGRLWHSNDGRRFTLHVDAPAEQGALIEASLKEAKDALFMSGQPSVTWLDALSEVCSRSLTTAQSAGRRDKYRVFIHLDAHGAWLNAGPAVPPSLLAKLTCDGEAVPLWETDARPVNVGRAQRIVPNRTRRLVEDRDRGCRFPGCSARSYLEVHHIVHWRDGGPTDTFNLVCLCPHHHDAHHRGEFLITGNADDHAALTFTDACGRRIGLGRPLPPDGPPAPPPRGHRYQHPVGEPVQQKWVYFSAPAEPTPPSESGLVATRAPASHSP